MNFCYTISNGHFSTVARQNVTAFGESQAGNRSCEIIKVRDFVFCIRIDFSLNFLGQ